MKNIDQPLQAKKLEYDWSLVPRFKAAKRFAFNLQVNAPYKSRFFSTIRAVIVLIGPG